MKDPDEFKKKFDFCCRKADMWKYELATKIGADYGYPIDETRFSKFINNELRWTENSIEQILRPACKLLRLTTEQTEDLVELARNRKPPPQPGGNGELPELRRLIGYRRELAVVKDGLTSPYPVVCIKGLAGTGKTHFATQIGHDCEETKAFESVVWISAKDQPHRRLWLEIVLSTVARLDRETYNRLPSSSVSPREKQFLVHELLKNHKTLVILDNYNTIDDEELDSWIARVPAPSKVLLTSRHTPERLQRMPGIVWHPVELKGLQGEEVVEYIDFCMRDLLLTLPISHEEKMSLARAANGNPLLIHKALSKYASSQDFVQTVKSAAQGLEGMREEFDQLTEPARKTLMVQTFFVGSAGAEALGAAVGLAEAQLHTALDQLEKMDLLDAIGKDATGQMRYEIHPIVRTIAEEKLDGQAKADGNLHRARKFEEEARERWAGYFLEFARRHLGRQPAASGAEYADYWDTAIRVDHTAVKAEWPNLRRVLEWAAEKGRDHLLLELYKALVHYMDRRVQYQERIDFGPRAAEAAQRLGRPHDQALLRIDALGWLLIAVDQPQSAIREINAGLAIASQLAGREAAELRALGHAFLAKAYVGLGDLAAASRCMDEAKRCNVASQVILARVHVADGDIEYKRPNYGAAVKAYRAANIASTQYNNDMGIAVVPLGTAYLQAHNDDEAEKAFDEVIRHYGKLGMPDAEALTGELAQALYGKAIVARNRACRLANEALLFLSEQMPRHGLTFEIKEFLERLCF